jgi:micrococcal nuclease
MKKPVLVLAVLAVCFLCPAGMLRQSPFPEFGTVTRVADGDTLSVRFSDGVERRVRLIGVDAPERNDPREETAWRAFLSWRFVFHSLYRRAVRLTYDFPPLDEYGRVLAYVWTGEGELFNELIIRQGFASAFLKYPFREDYQKRFRAAAAAARNEHRGFWRNGDPELILISEIRAHFGEIVSVRFRCAEVLKKRTFFYLRPDDAGFDALIPRDRAPAFPAADSWVGKDILLTGFVEEFAGRPQIMVFFSRQLRLT